jgi:hypothetical protein
MKKIIQIAAATDGSLYGLDNEGVLYKLDSQSVTHSLDEDGDPYLPDTYVETAWVEIKRGLTNE